MFVLLDSTVLIDCLRGRPAAGRVRGLWDAGDTPATSAVNVEEIARGVRADETTVVQRFLDSLVVLPLDQEAAWQSGVWRREFAARGVTLHQADCLVAATARAHSARLGTGNPKDFPMAGLVVEHWPVGE